MIIDFHTHVAWGPLYHPQFLSGLAEELVSGVLAVHPRLGRDKLERWIVKLMDDELCDAMVAHMDAAGVDRAVLLAMWRYDPARSDAPSQGAVYEHHRRILERHPRRFLAFAGVDPRSGDAGFATFRDALDAGWARGMKLYPPFGFRVDDPRLVPYLELCRERGCVVLAHGGPSLRTLDAEAARAHWLEPVAAQFDTVDFVIAHGGYHLDADSVRLARTLPNVYLDLAGFQSTYRRVDERTIGGIGRIFSDELCRKVLFGSDWPLFHLFSSIADDVAFLRNVFASCPSAGEPFRLEQVLHTNAQRLAMMSK